MFKAQEVLDWLEAHKDENVTELAKPQSTDFAGWFGRMTGPKLLETMAKHYKLEPPNQHQVSMMCWAIGILQYVEHRMIDDLAEKVMPPRHSILCRELGGGLWNCERNCEIRRSAQGRGK